MSILISIFRAVSRFHFRFDCIENKLDRILALLDPEPAASFIFTAVLDGKTTQGVTMLTLSDSQRAALTIRPVDKKGKPAVLDGPVAWAGSDDTVCTVTVGTLDNSGAIIPPVADDPAELGLSAVVEGVSPGSARVTVTGDANLGEGRTPITGVLEVTVTAGGAVSIEITAGAPFEL